MQKLSLRTLDVQEMEGIEGGIPWYKVAACGAGALAAGLALSETGPAALYVSDLTFASCVGLNW